MKWPTPALGQIATITGGSTPSRTQAEYWNGSIPWLTPTDLPMPGKGIADVSDTAGKITEEGLAAISAQLLPVGTVLFSSRATIGKLGISRVPLATNQGFANFIPKKFVNAKYLAYCLLHYTAEITALAGSTTFKEVTKTALKKFRIPLPPLSEQRCIVDMLDQVDALRKKRAEADEKAARILPALFYKMFGNPNENVSKDHFVKISKYAQIIMGQSPPGDTYNNNKDGLPFFQGKMDFGDINPIPRKWCSAPSRIAYQGDILLCVRAPVGPTNLANQKSCIGRGLAAIRPIAGKSISEFLLYSIKAQEKQIVQLGQGSTFSAIRRVDVENIPIPRVNIDKQRIFSKIAREIMDYQLKIRYRGKTLETLFSSLLHRAFTGELTAKWRVANMKELLKEMEQQAKALDMVVSKES